MAAVADARFAPMQSPCRAAKSTHAALMANLTTLGISARAARALDGDTDRLRYQLHKCVAAPEARPGPGCARGTCAAATKPQLRVVVVGCSMTQGFMNCGTTLPGRQCAQPCYSKRWPKLLEASLQRALPRCRVMVAVSTSRGGRTVTTASRYATRVARVGGGAPAIVITDLTICDLRGISSSLDRAGVEAGWELLIRKAYGHYDPNASTALMHVEAWDRFPMRGCANRSGETHFRLARHYRVPVVSFMLGACAMHPDGDARHWRGGCSPNASTCQSQDEPGLQCEPHPGPHTHAVYALLVAEAISREAAALCRGRRGAVDDAPSSGPALLPAPPRPLPLAADAPTLLPKEMVDKLHGCRAKHGVSNPTLTLDFVEGGCGAPASSDGWRCFEDRPGKRGWIAEGDAGAPSGVLSFGVDAAAWRPTGRLTVTFLRSYDRRMGRARLWLDADERAAVELNGSWARRTSQADIAIVPIRDLCGPACQAAPRDAAHRLSVQRIAAGGSKFKLQLLELC